MTRQEVFDYARQRYGTEPDYPWMDTYAVLRHADSKKWYAVILEVRRDKLGLNGSGMVDVLNVKCDPILIGSLRLKPGFHPAYHMSKDKWLTIRLDGSVSPAEIQDLIEMSYELTGSTSVSKHCVR